MKNLTLLLILLLPFCLRAQTIDQGVITYEQVIKVEIDLSKVPEGMGDMAKLIPKEQRFKKLLTFTPTQSLYVAQPKEEGLEEEHGPGSRMRVWMERSDDQTFTDLKKSVTVEQKEFFGRTFLVKEEVEKLEWKVTGQQKEILGYPCMMATAMKDTIPLTAWFTPLIPVSFGPENSGGQLPGMIMELSMNDGKISMVAVNLESRDVKKSEIVEPKKGKQVTQDEYREIVRAKMKEMQEQMGGSRPGGGGRHMMIMH